MFGISVDSAYCHRQFRDEYSLSFPLLSDRLAAVAEAFSVKYDVWENHPAVCQCALFAIDSTDMVRYRWRTQVDERKMAGVSVRPIRGRSGRSA